MRQDLWRSARIVHRPPKSARLTAGQARSMLPVDGGVPGAHRRLVVVVDRALIEDLVAPFVPLLATSDPR